MLRVLSCAHWPSVCCLWEKMVECPAVFVFFFFLIGLFAFLVLSRRRCCMFCVLTPCRSCGRRVLPPIQRAAVILWLISFAVQGLLRRLGCGWYVSAVVSLALGDQGTVAVWGSACFLFWELCGQERRTAHYRLRVPRRWNAPSVWPLSFTFAGNIRLFLWRGIQGKAELYSVETLVFLAPSIMESVCFRLFLAESHLCTRPPRRMLFHHREAFRSTVSPLST